MSGGCREDVERIAFPVPVVMSNMVGDRDKINRGDRFTVASILIICLFKLWTMYYCTLSVTLAQFASPSSLVPLSARSAAARAA